MRIALEAVGVRKVYPGPPPVVPVAGIDLCVAEGESVAVVGPSGSGKSTLLHLLAALDRPTAGTVRIDGIDVSGLPDAEVAGVRAHRLGIVFQQFHLIDSLTAVDNVATGLLYRGIRAARRRHLARTALDRVGLGHRERHRPTELSGGERQRVAIARAIVGEPAAVLADEPTGNLDSVAAAGLLDLLTGLHRDGATVLVVTHDAVVASTMHRQVEVRDGLIARDSGTGR